MFSPATRRAFAILMVVAVAMTMSFAQTQELDILKTDTDLVTVPVTATDKGGLYITDLRKEDFAITEDGVPQEIAFFGKVAAPFHVVLILDTSASTQDKLKLIQQAANAFVEQLQPADRVKVISFDDKVKDLNEFTNNREVLRRAIDGTHPGKGSKVYDAVDVALSTIRKIRGRKAMVIFTDGVDWYSDTASFEGTLRWLDEEGVVVYPIRYETRAATEKLAREQANETTPQLPTIDVIRRPPSGTTPTTFPSEDPAPTTGSTRRTGPWGLPTPEEIMRRRREDERNRRPDDPGRPDVVRPRDRRPSDIPGAPPTTTTSGRTDPGSDDSISKMLDLAYFKADQYLESLAEKSGGRLLRANTLGSLPDAFSQIAAELRTQYMLGYYPINKQRDERYRAIKVTTVRNNVVIRSRPGYLATATR